jgi:hypothetical protein
VIVTAKLDSRSPTELNHYINIGAFVGYLPFATTTFEFEVHKIDSIYRDLFSRRTSMLDSVYPDIFILMPMLMLIY